MSLSRSVTIAPIISCVNKATEVIKEKTGIDQVTWLPGIVDNPSGGGNTKHQKEFLDDIVPISDSIGEIPEIESIASRDVDVINSFLRARGFDISLQPFHPNDMSFGVAAVMELLSKWMKPGERWIIHHNRQKYAGVRVKDDVQFFESPGQNYPIARLNCTNGDQYYMTRRDEMIDLFNQGIETCTLNITKSIVDGMRQIYDYGAVVFPMIDFEEKPDIGWIVGLQEFDTGDVHCIRQAIQQTKFKMNHIGAEVKSAVAMEIMASGCLNTSFSKSRPDLVINKQFLLWVKRPGIELPLFVGHLFPDCWADPKIDEDQQPQFPFGRSFL